MTATKQVPPTLIEELVQLTGGLDNLARMLEVEREEVEELSHGKMSFKISCKVLDHPLLGLYFTPEKLKKYDKDKAERLKQADSQASEGEGV